VVASDAGAPAQTISVKGTVTAPTATPSYTKPTAFIGFLLRNDLGFLQDDTRNYQALTFDGAMASFDFEFTRDALGDARITYGAANVAMAFVVVFDDRASPDVLDDLFAPCAVAAVDTDCVIGMAPLALAFVEPSSPQLVASPFAHLTVGGYSQAVIVTDARNGGTKSGLVSLDPGKVLPFDVALWADPGAHSVPRLDLTVPATP
jgi:hypothetical protein